MRYVKAIVLSMFCLAMAACETVREAAPLRPDLDYPARLICEGVPDKRPAISPEYVIDWSKVETVARAKTEHEAYVRSVRTREGIVAGYVVEIEGKLFTCSNNAAFWRDYWSRLP